MGVARRALCELRRSGVAGMTLRAILWLFALAGAAAAIAFPVGVGL